MKTAQELITAFEDFVNKEISNEERKKSKLTPYVDIDAINAIDDRIWELKNSLEKLKELNQLKAA